MTNDEVSREKGSGMARISVEVKSGASRFRVAVQAESIRRALEIVQGQNPGRDVGVVFPIDPEMFFAGDRAAVSSPLGQEAPAA
jgi:hypothetical protein